MATNSRPLLLASLPSHTQVTGPALTLAGFPAWAARTAEIYGVGPLAAVEAEGLAAALRRYRTRTKQRFGK